MLFTYQARDLTGRIRDGEITADSAEEAAKQLRTEGMYLLSMEESDGTADTSAMTLFQPRISRNDIIYLTNQLAIMVDAGVPLAGALEGLAKQMQHPILKSTLQTIQKSVEAGDNLSKALAAFPRQFDSTYVNLVKASEASGALAPMLDRIAIRMRNELETRQKVSGAMMYPAFMMVMCVGVSTFLLAYVFPKLEPMFVSRSLDLPGPTKLMMALSRALTGQWYWFVAAIIVLVSFVWYARRQPWGRFAIDWLWLRLPIIGSLMRKVAISRSLRTLATTINAGVPVLEALQLSAGVAKNVHYEKCWMAVSEQVTSGRQIHEALEGSPLFPQMLLQMIASGEATGKLGVVLNKVSDYFDREVANTLRASTSLIEPIMVFVMGGVIGTIALAMLLPIFKLSSHTG